MQVSGAAADDKREITCLLTISMSNELLPTQVIYAGKTERVHPTGIKFPNNWHITQSEKHWSNAVTMLEYADKILIPHVKRQRSLYNLPNQTALAIFDIFAAHRTEDFLGKLRQNNISVIFVPAGCTGEVQPLDVAVNDVFKKKLKSKFTVWYSDCIQKELLAGKDVDEIRVNLNGVIVKPLNAHSMSFLMTMKQ